MPYSPLTTNSSRLTPGACLGVLCLVFQMYKLTSTRKSDGAVEVMYHYERPLRDALQLLNFYLRESVFTNTHDYALVAV